MKFNLTQSQKEIINAINQEGHVWVVGGAIRDNLMGKTPKDLDLCTNLIPSTTKSLVTKLGYTAIPDKTAENHGIIRVVDKDTGELIDIATLRVDVRCDGRHAEVAFTADILADLNRRDFTVNAIATPVGPDGIVYSLIDPHHGVQDIEREEIDFVGSPHTRVQEDALRLIRGCRFTALGENWGPSTRCFPNITSFKPNHIRNFWLIKDLPDRIKNISKERIRDEIIKALGYPTPSNFFRSLHAGGLLPFILPDLALGIGVEQNKHHAEDVFEHLMRCVDASVELADTWQLRLAALTHDIAKPHTMGSEKGGDTHFYKHEIKGASLVYKWMKEYKFCNDDCEYVSKMVRHHQWRFEKNSKDKTIRRWLQAVGRDEWRDLITLRCIDRRGNLAKQNKPMITSHMRDLIARAEYIIEGHQALFKEDLAINGKDIQALGVPPSKIYNEIFSNLLGIVINDPNKNTAEWLSDYIKRNYIK